MESQVSYRLSTKAKKSIYQVVGNTGMDLPRRIYHRHHANTGCSHSNPENIHSAPEATRTTLEKRQVDPVGRLGIRQKPLETTPLGLLGAYLREDDMRLARVITILDWERCEASRDQPWRPRGSKVYNGIRVRNQGGKWL